MKYLTVLLIMYSQSIYAYNVKVNLQDVTFFGSDLGVLIENTTSKDLYFTLYIQKEGCKPLGINRLQLKGSLSDLDHRGFIKANDFMAAYYTLGSYNLKGPCTIKANVEKIKNGISTIERFIFDINSDDKLYNTLQYPEPDNQKKLKFKHSFKRMNKTRYELSLLIENPNLNSILLELSRLDLICSVGDLFVKQTNNLLDGIKNGKSVIQGLGWRAYKIIYRNDGEDFNCKVRSMFLKSNKKTIEYNLSIDTPPPRYKEH